MGGGGGALPLRRDGDDAAGRFRVALRCMMLYCMLCHIVVLYHITSYHCWQCHGCIVAKGDSSDGGGRGGGGAAMTTWDDEEIRTRRAMPLPQAAADFRRPGRQVDCDRRACRLETLYNDEWGVVRARAPVLPCVRACGCLRARAGACARARRCGA